MRAGIVIVISMIGILAGSPAFADAAAASAALNVEIEQAYKALIEKLDAPDATVLKADQADYIVGQAAKWPDGRNRFVPISGERLIFLKSVNTKPPAGYAGRWENLYGYFEIAEKTRGLFSVTALVASPYSGGWICEFEGDGKIENGELEAVEKRNDSSDGLSDLFPKSVKPSVLHLTRQSGHLNVFAKPEEQATLCGWKGSINGNFFAVKQ
ncbi:MAG: hypothetical protein Q7T44_07105 [Parvibaculum sp.]|nr:hypothetical protein [Parvibaculum sp.]